MPVLTASPIEALDQLLRGISRNESLSLPYPIFQDVYGKDLTEMVINSGLVDTCPLDEGDLYPCELQFERNCRRRVLIHEAGLRAVCGLGTEVCAEIQLGYQESRELKVAPKWLARWLAQELRLEGAVARCGPVWRVGELATNARRLVLYYLPFPGMRSDWGWVDGLRFQEPSSTLLLCYPHTAGLPAEGRSALITRQIPHFGLERLLTVEWDRVHACFGGVLPEVKGCEIDPARFWPRLWLVLDPKGSRCWLAGQELGLGRSKAALVLEALARRPEASVDRANLYEAGWGIRPKLRKGLGLGVSVEKAITDAISKIRAAFSQFGYALPSAEWIETDRSGGTTLGGFRLVMPASRIGWLSQPELLVL